MYSNFLDYVSNRRDKGDAGQRLVRLKIFIFDLIAFTKALETCPDNDDVRSIYRLGEWMQNGSYLHIEEGLKLEEAARDSAFAISFKDKDREIFPADCGMDFNTYFNFVGICNRMKGVDLRQVMEDFEEQVTKEQDYDL